MNELKISNIDDLFNVVKIYLENYDWVCIEKEHLKSLHSNIKLKPNYFIRGHKFKKPKEKFIEEEQ